MSGNIQLIRKEYTIASLDPSDVSTNPLDQFTKWFNEALSAEVHEPNAMVVSTVNTSGAPSARVVLLKGLENGGFTFYTNYKSQKGKELEKSHLGCITFFWAELERQVRIEGTIEKVSAEESDAYFSVRPRGSQIGAWVSNQSEVIASREVLEQKQIEIEAKFDGQTVPRPAHWGGYKLTPNKIEFWQGRPNRLHDRVLYTLLPSNAWKIERLSP